MSVADDLRDGTVNQDDAAHVKALKTERMKRRVKREVDAEERGTDQPPEILTLRERLARPRPLIEWRIESVQGTRQRVLLAAQFKAGKTTLAANLARSVLDGDSFLGAYHTTPIEGVLVLLDFEMSPTQLDSWYEAQQITNDDRLLVIPLRGAASAFDITNDDVRCQWAERLKTRGAKYLILDCLRPVLDALGLNEHTEAGLFLTALDALLRDGDIPEALVIQHMGHHGERARGDSRLLDWPDVGWTLVREKDDDPASPRYFKAYGRDVDVPETRLAYDPTTRRLSAVDAAEGGVTRASAKVAAALTALNAYMAHADTPQSRTDIENALMAQEHTRDVVRKAVHLAVDMGVLIAEPGGRGGGSKYRSLPRPDFLSELTPPNPVGGVRNWPTAV